MKVSFALRILAITLACALGATPVSAASGGPEDAVIAFNAAFKAKDKDAAVAMLAVRTGVATPTCWS